MAAINALCSRCVILSGGTVEFDGPTSSATTRYYADALNVMRRSGVIRRDRAKALAPGASPRYAFRRWMSWGDGFRGRVSGM